jgi:hypothetical protein
MARGRADAYFGSRMGSYSADRSKSVLLLWTCRKIDYTPIYEIEIPSEQLPYALQQKAC